MEVIMAGIIHLIAAEGEQNEYNLRPLRQTS